jgi:hypothetical protein
VGATVSVREKKRGYRFGCGKNGPWAASVTWPKGFPGVHFYFFCVLSFSLFCFPISFITFSNLVQIDSNRFVNFSKIQLNILGQ